MNAVNIFALTLLIIGITSAEMFSSVARVRDAIYAQRKIVDELRSYIAEEKARLDDVKKMMNVLVEDSAPVEEAALEEFISNPINTYLAVKNFQRENFDFKNKLNNNRLVNETLKRIGPYLDALPLQSDFEGSIGGLLRLQETYNLRTSSFVDGFNRTTQKMTAQDCFEIGQLAYRKDKYDMAVIWLNEAYQMTEKEPATTVDKVMLLDYLAFSNFKIGEISLALKQTEEMLQLDPNHPKALRNMRYYKYLLDYQPAAQKLTVNNNYSPLENENYRKLCRGEKTVPIKNAHKLYCDYARNNDPRLLIAPLKRETVHLDPWIMLYHDVISDDEIAFFKKTAFPKMDRALAVDPNSDVMKSADYRVSQIAWLANDTDTYYAPRILNRISAMTQLTLEYSELLQVGNYGVGGYYTTHFDFSEDDKTYLFGHDHPGNRMATLLFYMSDVEAGGATIFNQLGLTIFPKKGAAAFWYNLYKDGRGDRTLIHAACPVLYGSKWVMNKWFHYGGNEFWHPCNSNNNPFDRFKPQDIDIATPTYHRIHGRMQF